MRRTWITDLFFHRIPLAVSVLFHPLIMPTLGILLLLYAIVPFTLMNDDAKRIIIILVLVTTFIIPLALLPILYYRKLHQAVFKSERQERIIPLIFTSLMYFMAFYSLRRLGVPYLIQFFMFASTLSVVFTLLISLFWKISAHAIGIGGLTAFIVIMMMFYHVDLILYLFIAILLSGIICSSRLGLHEHTPLQVYVGYITGFLVMYFSFYIL